MTKTVKTKIKTQVTLRQVTWNGIMMKAAFRLGMEDAAAGRFNPDRKEVRGSIDDQWDYERGWSFGRLTGMTRPTKVNARRVVEREVVLFYKNSRRFHNGEQINPSGIL